VGGERRGPTALHPGKTQYPLYRSLGGPQDRSGRVRKISLPPGFDPQIVQLVPSRYTNWATPAHLSFHKIICFLLCCVASRLVIQRVRQVVGRLAGWLGICSLVWLVGWLVGYLVVCLLCCLVGWLIDWCDWMTVWFLVGSIVSCLVSTISVCPCLKQIIDYVGKVNMETN
jgi:hypothetical protein